MGHLPRGFRWLVVLIAVAASSLAWPQTVPAIDQAPPQIEFAPWKEVPTDNEDVSEFDVSFPSAIETPYRQNNTVPVRIILPARADKPLPVVIILHYWGATDLRVERELAAELNDRGIGAAIMTLPYHLERTPAGSRSGQTAIRPETEHLIATMTQAVLDARRTIDFLGTRPEIDHTKIGIAGTSLGSLISVLAYAVDSRISSAAFVLGGVDLAHILWHSSRVVEVSDELRRRGYTEVRLRTELSSIEPARYLATRAPASTFVIGGKYDTVIPPTDTQKLIDLLPQSKVLWLDTGHYGGVFVERRLLRTVAEFFDKQFGGQNFVPPLRIYAPTIRIGAILNTDSGLQVGGGIDLFSIGRQGEGFSTLIITPKGPEIFVGARVSHGLAVGGFGSRRKLGVGLWWSTVL